MANPVLWNRGPWATVRQPTPQPYQNLLAQPAAPQIPVEPYQYLLEQEGGGTPGTGIGPDVSGPMTSAERGQFNSLTDPVSSVASAFGSEPGNRSFGENAAVSAGRTMASMGLSALGLGPMSTMMGATRLGVSALNNPGVRSFFGMGPERNIIEATMAERQAMADRLGYGMPGAPEGIVGGVSVGPSGYGTTGPSGVSAPSVGNPDQEGMFGGGTTDQGADQDGARGSSDVGSDAAGTGGAWAKGGVKKFRGPARPLVGEGGDETAIFVPEKMKRKGFQGKEREVRKGLKRTYSSLIK